MESRNIYSYVLKKIDIIKESNIIQSLDISNEIDALRYLFTIEYSRAKNIKYEILVRDYNPIKYRPKLEKAKNTIESNITELVKEFHIDIAEAASEQNLDKYFPLWRQEKWHVVAFYPGLHSDRGKKEDRTAEYLELCNDWYACTMILHDIYLLQDILKKYVKRGYSGKGKPNLASKGKRKDDIDRSKVDASLSSLAQNYFSEISIMIAKKYIEYLSPLLDLIGLADDAKDFVKDIYNIKNLSSLIRFYYDLETMSQVLDPEFLVSIRGQMLMVHVPDEQYQNNLWLRLAGYNASSIGNLDVDEGRGCEFSSYINERLSEKIVITNNYSKQFHAEAVVVNRHELICRMDKVLMNSICELNTVRKFMVEDGYKGSLFEKSAIDLVVEGANHFPISNCLKNDKITDSRGNEYEVDLMFEIDNDMKIIMEFKSVSMKDADSIRKRIYGGIFKDVYQQLIIRLGIEKENSGSVGAASRCIGIGILEENFLGSTASRSFQLTDLINDVRRSKGINFTYEYDIALFSLHDFLLVLSFMKSADDLYGYINFRTRYQACHGNHFIDEIDLLNVWMFRRVELESIGNSEEKMKKFVFHHQLNVEISSMYDMPFSCVGKDRSDRMKRWLGRLPKETTIYLT